MGVLKVCFLINSLQGGGAERVTATLATHFANHYGYDVVVVTLLDARCSYELPPSVRLRHLRAGAWSSAGGKVLLIPMMAAEFNRILREERPDATISLLVRSNLVHLATRWFGNRNPIVTSDRSDLVATYEKRTFGNAVMRQLIRSGYPNTDRVVAISEGVKESLTCFGVSPEKVSVIYNPQDIGDIQRRSRADAPPVWLNTTGEVGIRLITVNRLFPQKDYHTLIRALAIINRRDPASLAIIGEGPDEPALKALAIAEGVNDRIAWLGWQDNPFAQMRACDYFVLSSRFEGFGNVIVEAMACGLPVVATACPSGPEEILDNGRYGELVPVGDAQKMADAILALHSDPARRAELTAAGFRRAADFDVSVIAPEYLRAMGVERPARSNAAGGVL